MYRTDSNASVQFAANVASDSRNAQAQRPVRYRNRDFGTGYGASSGYAAPRRYTPGSQPVARFRLV